MTIDPNAISPTPETSGGEDAGLRELVGELVERAIKRGRAIEFHGREDVPVHTVGLERAKKHLLAYIAPRLSPPSSSGEEGEHGTGKPCPCGCGGTIYVFPSDFSMPNTSRHPHSGETRD